MGRQIGAAVTILAAIMTFGASQRLKGRKQGAERVSRRAEAASYKRRDIRNEIDDDDDVSVARDRLRDSWADNG